MKRLLIWAAATILVAAACGSEDKNTNMVPVPLDPALGGDTTRESKSRNAFSLPAPKLSNEERRTFEVGDSFFNQNWVTAPASTDARDGLGPLLNAQACSSCHLHDGRGLVPDPDSDKVRLGLFLRLSVPGEDPITGAPLGEPNYGGQLQDRSILGVPAEARLEITHTPVLGEYGDGTVYSLSEPTYEVADLAYGPMASDTMFSPRLSPAVFGVGLLEAIPEENLLQVADPDDSDSDGISGRPNTVWDARAAESTVGRFGWKANTATVEAQVAGAFHGDIGITSALHPDQNCTEVQDACAAAMDGGQPELTDARLFRVTFYNRTLAVPAMRGIDNPDVQAGAKLFGELGCSSCHTPTQHSGPSDVATLANQTFYPYTDLLLHDMGDGLADGRPDFDATGSEWRTPPLWGIGLIEVVNGERFLLHDGRARTLEEAILWHGGEAEAAKERFRLADADDRAALVAFLEAL